jgi:hypothetical protein
MMDLMRGLIDETAEYCTQNPNKGWERIPIFHRMGR